MNTFGVLPSLKRILCVFLALATALIGQASAISVSPPQTLDSPWTLQQGQFVDSQVAARDGYYYQIKGPAVAVDSSGTTLVAWEDWSENGKVAGKIGLKVLSANGTPSSAAYVTPAQDCVDFGPALASYDQGKFLLAVTEVSEKDLITQDYGKLLVYKVDVSGNQISISKPVLVSDNAAYPHMVYIGSDSGGNNKYVALVYEHWNGSSGDVELQVLKIDQSGNVSLALSQPLTIAKNVCKDYVKDNMHYFAHPRPVVSVYEDASGKRYLVIALTDYSQAIPNISSWGYFGEWDGCKVRAYVVDLPQDLSKIGELSDQNVHEVQGSLSGTTNECPWVCDNVVVYRVGPLWGSMTGSTTLPDINAALIVRSGNSWTFSSDTTIYRRIWTQTFPSVAKVYTDANGTPYYLAVFSDNSGGFGRERIAGVLFRVKNGQIQVIAQYDFTGFGNNYYYYCPVVKTVQGKYGNAELVLVYYKGDTGYGGHNAGDVVASMVTVSDPVDEFMSSTIDLLTNLAGTVDVINNAVFNGYSGLEKRVSNLENDFKNLKKEVSNLKDNVEKLENNISNISELTQTVNNLENNVNNLTKTINNVEKRVSNLENEVNNLKNNVNNLTKIVSNVKSAQENLEKEVAGLKENVSKVKMEVQSIQNKINNIQKQSEVKKPQKPQRKSERVPVSSVTALLAVAALAARRKYW